MVYSGPSRGCATCRKRRIKCDEGRPACKNCVKRKQECPGYRDVFDIMLKDQTVSVPQKAQRKQAAKEKRRASEDHNEDESSSPDSELALAITQSLPPDAETASLCFFFTHYVAIARDPSISRGFLEHLLPVYSQTTPSSPLSLATSAVAVNISSMWLQNGPGITLARSIFSNALSSTKAAISDPVQATTDETLLTVLLLEFYEAVGSRFNNKDSSGTHQSGAIALVKHRGEKNFESDLAKGLLVAVRSQAITHALQRKQRVDFDPAVWEDRSDMPVNPAIELDKLVAELANLQVAVESNSTIASPGPLTPTTSTTSDRSAATANQIFTEALDLETRLSVWSQCVPFLWHPVAVYLPEHVHPSIVEAGMYAATCDVYISIHVAIIYNQWRCTRLAVLNIILKCCDALGSDLMGGFSTTQDYARKEIQSLVDQICDSAPYYLGNRTKPTSIDHSIGIEYPTMPMSKDSPYPPEFLQYALTRGKLDHARLAAALGGHFLISTLLAVLRTIQEPGKLLSLDNPPLLRKGQVQWIYSQLDRLRDIYTIPKPARALPSPEGSKRSFDVSAMDDALDDCEVIPRTYKGDRKMYEDEAWMTALRGKHPSRPLS